jgi:hypothetical protein
MAQSLKPCGQVNHLPALDIKKGLKNAIHLYSDPKNLISSSCKFALRVGLRDSKD